MRYFARDRLGLIFVRLRLVVPRVRQPWTLVPCSTLSRAKNCRYIAAFIRSADSGGCRPSPRRLAADRLPSRREVPRDLGPPRRKLVDVQSIDAVRMYEAPSDELGPRLISRCPLRFADDESGDSRRRLI